MRTEDLRKYLKGRCQSKCSLRQPNSKAKSIVVNVLASRFKGDSSLLLRKEQSNGLVNLPAIPGMLIVF